MKRVLTAIVGASLFLAGCGQQGPSSGADVPEAYRDQAGADWSYTAPDGGLAPLTLPADGNTWNAVVSASSGWGPIEINRSNGEKAAGDGRPITMGGKVYAFGLGLHSRAEITYRSARETGLACQFSAEVGIDDEVGNRGSIQFQAFADGVRLYDSGVLRGSDPAAKRVSFTFPSARSLSIVVTDAGDNNYSDHTNIANPLLNCAPAGVQVQDRRPVVTGLAGNHEQPDPANSGGTLPTTVTIQGRNLQGATVNFGHYGAGTDVRVNADGTQLTAVAPLGESVVPIIVSTPQGKVNAGPFYYFQRGIRPLVHLLSISPTSGPAAGGTVVGLSFIGDLNYSPVAQPPFDLPDVYFGTARATRVFRDSSGQINAVAPAGTGEVDVTLRCPLTTGCYTLRVSEGLPFLYTP